MEFQVDMCKGKRTAGQERIIERSHKAVTKLRDEGFKAEVVLVFVDSPKEMPCYIRVY